MTFEVKVYCPLDAVREWLGRYVITVQDSDLDLLALWAAHTHVVQETYTTPRLLIDSPVPGSGKTTCLEHLGRLCVNPVQMAAVSSSALLVRLLEEGVRTLLIDEADRTLRPDADGTPDLIAVLNSGYKRGATRPVLVPEKGGGWVSREMSTFAPVVMAGNNPHLPDDTRTRCIRVLLMPDTNGTVEESDWELIEADAMLLGQQLAAWADLHRVEIGNTRPPLPEGIVGRLREKWQPLARVAAVAGGRWPQVVDELAVADREQIEADREDGLVVEKPHVILLRHLFEVWPDGERFMPTTTLVAALIAAHPEMWGDGSAYGRALTTQRLGRMLATSYKVNSGRSDDPARTRGYYRARLESVWDRFGMGTPPETGRTGQSGRTGQAPSGSARSSGPAGSKQTPTEPAKTGCKRFHADRGPVCGCYSCEQEAGQ